MNAFERLMVFISSLILGAIGVFLFSVAKPLCNFVLKHLPSNVPLKLLHVEIIVYAITVLVLLRALQMFFRSFRVETNHSQSIDKKTELGEIQITMETLENLSLKAISRMKGIHDVKAVVRTSEAGLQIKLRGLVDGDQVIPTLSEEMQKVVKSHVEAIAGIPVSNVIVRITNIQKTPVSKSRLD
jgi:uncharacterized alkaline shock family protein YloU